MDDQPEETLPVFPLEKILVELVDLLQFAVKNIDKMPKSASKVDVDQQLRKLQQDIAIFDATEHMTLAYAENKELLPEEIKQLFKKCDSLKGEMRKKLDALHAEQDGKEPKAQVPLPETPQESIERKQKGLRRIGRSQKWKQL